MIRNEAEHQAVSTRLAEETQRFDEHRLRLQQTGLRDVDIQRFIDPLESFHLQLKEEMEAYQGLKRGEFEELENLRGVGHLLIISRIAIDQLGLTPLPLHGGELEDLRSAYEPYRRPDPYAPRRVISEVLANC